MLVRHPVSIVVVLSLVLAACSSNRNQSEPRPQGGTVRSRIDSAAGRLTDTIPDTSSVRDTATSR